ncbi:hypothetical protein [Paraburkholderia youngii]|uniref:hypothetical protein n=1 Tax=Paraburkholderia youngii TaxID=2782701 RepID=UPI003D1CFA11
MNEKEQAAFAHAFGKRVRFTANDAGQPLSVGIIEGILVDVQSSSGGNFRLRVRTDKDAPQGGGKVAWNVYSHQGDLKVLEEEPKPRWKQHHEGCPVCHEKLSRQSPNGIDLIFECPAMHHRHMITGSQGEYITMSPASPARTTAAASISGSQG